MINVLLITNKSDITTDFVVKKLTEQNINFYRLNTEDLLNKNSLSFNFSSNEFILYDSDLNLEIDLLKIKSVYYRRPLTPSFSTKNLTPGEENFVLNEITYWLEGLYKILKNAFWISPVFSIREAESKIHQLNLAKEMGFQIPKSLVTSKIEVANKFINENVSIIKPIKTGLVSDNKDDKVIFTTLFNDKLKLERIKFCPTFFQEFIPKVADVRVTIVGEKVFSSLILSQEFDETKVDWRSGENLKLKYEKFTLPKEISDLCVSLNQRLGLNFSAIDFVKDSNDNYIFLEVNPNGQWAWIEKQLNYDISFEIANLLIKPL